MYIIYYIVFEYTHCMYTYIEAGIIWVLIGYQNGILMGYDGMWNLCNALILANSDKPLRKNNELRYHLNATVENRSIC